MRRASILACALVAALTAQPAIAAEWSVPGAFATIQQAVDDPAVAPGDTIVVGPGAHGGAIVTKSVEIVGQDGAAIVTGPIQQPGWAFGFLLMDGASGTTISHLEFRVAFPVFNRAGRLPGTPGAHDVTVSHSTFVNPVQGVTNWGGSRWNISHNRIVDLRCRNGGGIGIFVGDFMGRAVTDNVVAHNTVSGTLHVDPADKGGYSGTGIVLYADFRWQRDGGSISWNRVVKNKVSLDSDTPNVVDVVGIELTDTRNIPGQYVVRDNAIGFNDVRGTASQIVLTPDDLDRVNSISRNLGENRGHGLHPSVFSD